MSNILKSHQQRAIRKILNTELNGLLIYHLMGGGKTLTALSFVEQYIKINGDSSVLFIIPPSLTTHYEHEICKFHIKLNSKINFFSYGMLNKSFDKFEKNDILIIDEAHKLRNYNTKSYSSVLSLSNKSKKILLLTGTPIYNSFEDLFSLINIISKNKEIPLKKDKLEEILFTRKNNFFHKIFNKNDELISNKGKKFIEKNIKTFVDYYDGSNDDLYPIVTIEDIYVKMNSVQAEYYNAIESKIPLFLRVKIWKSFPLNKKELKVINPFSIALRQISNSAYSYTKNEDDLISPKAESILKNINTELKSIVYSNFIESGINIISYMLNKKNINHFIITGKTSKKKIGEILNKFKTSDVNILLISSCASEGINLTQVEHVHIMEPHFNYSKIDQVIGRARRLDSHNSLKKEKNMYMFINI